MLRVPSIVLHGYKIPKLPAPNSQFAGCQTAWFLSNPSDVLGLGLGCGGKIKMHAPAMWNGG